METSIFLPRCGVEWYCEGMANLGPQLQEWVTQVRADYYTYRGAAAKLKSSAHSSYDKAVMALSGGALGLSLTVLKEHPLGGNQWVDLGLATAAMIFWAASVALIFISLYTSIKSADRTIELVDEKLKLPDDELVENYKFESNGWNTWTAWLNFFAGAGFVCGVISFVMFLNKNLSS